MICPYCNKPAEWVSNAQVYGRIYGKSFMVWLCKKCDARVGCHNNTQRPLGTMANRELREWRMKAHAHIDPIWKTGQLSRGMVYKMLDDYFGFEVHVGEADIKMCKKIIEFDFKV